jgi:hypothetical protein
MGQIGKPAKEPFIIEPVPEPRETPAPSAPITKPEKVPA